MSPYTELQSQLRAEPQTWLITGVAGFIGSNLLAALLRLGQRVVGLDNFATGHRHNLASVRAEVGEASWANFELIEGDITDLEVCQHAVVQVTHVLHQAALGSVPRSLADPLSTHRANVDGFVNLLVAARDAGARFVYAASSSTYGDHPGLPKVEDQIGAPLSPYAVTKYVGELYAAVFARAYGTASVGLRYFNVFGPRQDPAGAYAAVIPRWIGQLGRRERPTIYGDGETSRDFCFIDNVVQANLLAATRMAAGEHQIYNVAAGQRTSLNELFCALRDGLAERRPELGVGGLEPVYGPFRTGDVRHSLADISKAQAQLGYRPTHSVAQGLARTLDWFSEPAAALRGAR